MRRNSSKRGKVAATFMVILLTATFMALLLPEATADPSTVEIVSITPESGPVGETVLVNGTIDTVNGSYQILFDGKEVKNGNATETEVNVTFTVPLSVEGSHNVTLLDDTTQDQSSMDFTVTTSYYVSVEPTWIQEGFNTNITLGVNEAEPSTTYVFTVNVTDPQLTPGIYTTNLSISTNTAGSGSNSTFYPEDFSEGANTDYVGTYNITVIAVNQTFTTGNFTVGLTDKLEYERQDTVNIHGSGYKAGEVVTVDITATGVSVVGYPKNVTANIDGVVTDSWLIPENATAGTHTITLTNATATGTNKKPADAQNFTVLGALCQVQAWNLAIPPEPVADVDIVVFNATSGDYLYDKYTNETGWAEFPVYFGNYTFKVYNVSADVLFLGSRNESFTEIKTYRLNLTCWITNLKITIQDEAGHPLPFIDVTLNYTYTTFYNTTVSREDTLETNITGIVTLRDTLTNISYTIEARRYGHLFNRTLIENLTVTPLINITCPTYTMFINVLDSDGSPFQNAQVKIYDFSSGNVSGPETTNASGSLSFDCMFGRYKIIVHNYSAELGREVVLNETIIDLTDDHQFVVIRCKISNLELSVVVTDYFGQPIPNAMVKVEREFGHEYVNIDNLLTRSDGTVLLPKIGGNYRISVYVMNKLFDIKTLYLDESKVIVFRIDKLVVIGGHPLEFTQFLACILLSTMVIVFALTLVYRKLRLRKAHKGEEKEKSL